MRHKGIAVIVLLAVLAWGGSSSVEAEPPKKPDLSGEWTCEGFPHRGFCSLEPLPHTSLLEGHQCMGYGTCVPQRGGIKG